MAFWKGLYSPKYWMKKEKIIGEVPSVKTIYGNAMHVAWPSMVEYILVYMVSIVDTVMVSTLGTSAIAAVGITTQPKHIIFALFASLNIGVTAVVARRKGEGDPTHANDCLRQGLFITIIMSIVLSGLTIIFMRPFLLFAGAGLDIIDDAIAYFTIIMLGYIFSTVSMLINAAQRGSGNTQISMRTNLTANLVNVVFNFLLIGGNLGFPRLGIRGAAIATVIGNMVGCGMSIASVLKKDGFLKLSFRHFFKIDFQSMKMVLIIGSGAAFEQLCMRIGFFTFAKLAAGLGTLQFAVHQIGMNIVNIASGAGEGISAAASSLVGQNLGKKRPDMAFIYTKTLQRVAIVVSAVISVIYITCARPLAMMYSKDETVISMALPIFYLIAIITMGETLQKVYSGSLRGAGDTKFVAILSLVSISIVRPFIAWFLCYQCNFGLVGIWSAIIVDQYTRFIAGYIRFNTDKWTKIRA